MLAGIRHLADSRAPRFHDRLAALLEKLNVNSITLAVTAGVSAAFPDDPKDALFQRTAQIEALKLRILIAPTGPVPVGQPT
jgi:hypothetical protein